MSFRLVLVPEKIHSSYVIKALYQINLIKTVLLMSDCCLMIFQ